MLEVNNIDVSYGNVQVLWDISLQIEKGEMISIIGSNGAGKSTISKTIMGFLKPKKGGISFQGKRIDGMPTYEIIKEGISLVPERRSLFGEMNVRENLLLGAYSLKDKSRILENLEWVYKIFPRLKERQKQQASTMSGGEQQMLAIGRGLMSNPRLLILDEPSLGLAPVMVRKVFDTIKTLNKENGLTIIVSAQNVRQALKMSDRGYVIETGRVAMEGKGAELLDNPKVKEAYLGI